jgi:hypothetical protein
VTWLGDMIWKWNYGEGWADTKTIKRKNNKKRKKILLTALFRSFKLSLSNPNTFSVAVPSLSYRIHPSAVVVVFVASLGLKRILRVSPSTTPTDPAHARALNACNVLVPLSLSLSPSRNAKLPNQSWDLGSRLCYSSSNLLAHRG